MLCYLFEPVKGDFDFFGRSFLAFLLENVNEVILVVRYGIEDSDGYFGRYAQLI